MKMGHAMTLAAVAGLGFSTLSFAQSESSRDGFQLFHHPAVHPSGFPGNPYADRAIGAVYDSYANCGNNYAFLGGGSGNKRILDDVSFAPGPWASPQTKLITRMVAGMGTTAGGRFDAHFIFWRASDFNYAGFTGDGTSMINQAGTPISVLPPITFDFPANTGDFVSVDLSGLSGGGVTIPSDVTDIVIECWISAEGGTTQTAAADPGSFIFATNSNLLGNSAIPGTTVADYGRDFNFDGVLAGRALAENVAGAERRFITAVNGNPTGPANVSLNWGCALYGNFTATPPAATSIGCIADGVTTRSGSVANNGVTWYSVCLNGAARDNAGAAGQFLDLDTEGSAADVAIGVYKADGSFIAADDDAGSGSNAQLSFGIGRRAAVGDGFQYDGRNYDKNNGSPIPGLNSGTYYIAVGPAGTAFGDGFTTVGGSAGGLFTLNLNTNVNGAALAPSVSPAVIQDLGQVVVPGAQIAPAGMDPYAVEWFKFNVCQDVSDPASFLDISTEGTDAPDMIIMLFNAAGNRVALDVDSGSGVTSQLSFGQTSPARPAPGDGLPFAGQNGPLPAGDYYLGASYNFAGVGVAQAPSTNGRFHMRSYTNNAGYQFSLTLTPSWTECGSTCHGTCVADFDDGSGTGTPDGGVTIDDLLYYLGLFEAGTVCGDVDDGSGTGTPDQGVTIDDLLYYLLRFEAGC